MKATTLRIDEMLFMQEFGRDDEYSPRYDQTAYLDRETGEIEHLFVDDRDAIGDTPCEELAALRERISSARHRFLEIPELGHGAHHDLLGAFLASGDHEAGYYHSEFSIGKWKRAVREETWFAYVEFRHGEVKRRAEAWLRDRGIGVKWG
jgi:hypothetical protein